MNFYNRIKAQLVDDRNNRGYGQNTVVDRRALRMLIDDYERMDEKCRSLAAKHSFERFNSIMRSEYMENKRKEGAVFMSIASILKPLIEEDQKRDRICKQN